MYNQYVIPPWLLLYAPYYLAFHSTLWRGADQELHQPGIEAETQSFVDLWDSCGCDKSDIWMGCITVFTIIIIIIYIYCYYYIYTYTYWLNMLKKGKKL